MDAPKAEEHTLKCTAADTLEDSSKDISIASSTPLRYKTILVPHDGSTTANIALKHAIYLSNLWTRTLILIVGSEGSKDNLEAPPSNMRLMNQCRR